MMEHPKAISLTRGNQLRDEWRRIRRGWLMQLSRRNDCPETRLPYLNDDERVFVQRCRLEAI